MADDPTPDPAPDDDPTPDPDPDPTPDPTPEPKEEDWKAHARKHEREAKKERKAREDLERKLAERDDADKTEHEKAVEQARKEGEEAAQKAAQAERRQDRLEVAITREASRGLTLEVDGEEKTIRFADPDDALVHIDRAIKAGDVDPDDIFDSEGKVNTEALKNELTELLKRKPHLQDTNGTAPRRPSGSADAGKGSGPGKGLEDMSVEDHHAAIRRTK